MTRPPPELAASVRHFLYSCIDSIDQLDTLLKIRESERPWTVREASAALGTSAEATRGNLEALVSRGLVRVRVGEQLTYWYEPKSKELESYVQSVVEHHRADRNAVLTIVAPHTRGSLKNFADAFKLRDPEQ
jgi:hypothetical protein